MCFTYRLDHPWLIADFEQPQKMLGWSLTHPGFSVSNRVVWLEVKDTDLDIDTDANAFLADKMKSNGFEDAVGLMTSREVRYHHHSQSTFAEVTGQCLTTLGLNNGSHAGFPDDEDQLFGYGTINTLCHVNVPLTDGAMAEASSIVTEARTVALLDYYKSRDPLINRITGTGTDCIIVACPVADDRTPFAGLHTDVGKAIGKAVYQATIEAVQVWQAAKDKSPAPID
jgi:adenosylcobinamide amidohydrolase